MSEFKVFGRCFDKALKKAEKNVKSKRNESLTEWEQRVREKAKAYFDDMKPIAISRAYDAPQFCLDYIGIAEKSHNLFADLHVRAYQNKTDEAGLPVRHKKTGQIVKAWLPYHATTK